MTTALATVDRALQPKNPIAAMQVEVEKLKQQLIAQKRHVSDLNKALKAANQSHATTISNSIMAVTTPTMIYLKNTATGTTTATVANMPTWTTSSSSGTNVYTNPAFMNATDIATQIINRYTVRAGQEVTIELPDGAILEVAADGSYRMIDADAKVTYKANRVREFNRYINASDLLEEFIDFVGEVGSIGKDGFLALPIELFIRWLVLRAAEADGDEAPEEKSALQLALAPEAKKALPAPTDRCNCCGRFIKRQRARLGMLFCSTEHFARFEERVLSTA